jgi:hypothetical protein
MRAARRLCLLALVALMGCAARGPVILREPVGPERADGTPPEPQGTLIVYSATRVSSSEQSEYPVHTGYTIYTQNYQVLKQVENLAGTFNQYPEKVTLPPGRYCVKALAVRAGEVFVPVVIEMGKATVVDLDGTALTQGARSQSDWVRLPDGHVVGRAAKCNAQNCP